MSNIAIMTDSTCGLPADVIERENLIVIPCQVQVDDRVYREGVDLSVEELHHQIFASTAAAVTSMPTGEDYAAAFEEAQRRGATQVLGIFMGSGFSGTLNGARLAAQDYALDVELVDSGTVSLGLGLLVLQAVEKVKSGRSLQEAATAVREIAERTEIYALLDTLEFIRRGGRIGRVGELIATAFDIKPVLQIGQNTTNVVARNRSRKKGLAWLLDRATQQAPLQAAGVAHIGVLAEAQELARSLAPLVQGDQELIVTPLTAAVAVHAGPKAIGIILISGETPL